MMKIGWNGGKGNGERECRYWIVVYIRSCLVRVPERWRRRQPATGYVCDIGWRLFPYEHLTSQNWYRQSYQYKIHYKYIEYSINIG